MTNKKFAFFFLSLILSFGVSEAYARANSQELMALVEMKRKLIQSAAKPQKLALLKELQADMRAEIQADPNASDEAFGIAVNYLGLTTTMINKSCQDARSFVQTGRLDPQVKPTEKQVAAERRRVQYQLQFVDAYCK